MGQASSTWAQPDEDPSQRRLALRRHRGLRAQRRAAFLGAWWRGLDRPVLGAVVTLYGMGVMLAFAASPVIAARLGEADPHHFAVRHLAAAVLGVAAMVGVSMLDRRAARRLSAMVLAIATAGLVATLLVGPEFNGARRWLSAGPLSVQPAEFVKPTMVVLAAWLIAAEQALAGHRDRPPGGAITVLAGAGLAALLLAQPDVGQAVLLIAALGVTSFLAGARLRWLLAMGAAAAAVGVGAYRVFPHVARRVDDFIVGGGAATYQADRARAAFAEGGLFGVGPGEAERAALVPDVHADYVLALAAEEYGALAVAAIVAAFAVIVVRTMARVGATADRAARAAAGGLAGLIGLQAFVNAAVTMDLAPPKGMTLPFISYGGSSLLASGLAAGLMLAFSRRRADVDTVRSVATGAAGKDGDKP